ncbi:MAG: hypothetical protein OEQ14_03660 [Gammaproteobacteria bacterium]|nr:hypothetical protein [Gammaproteobacteria bacterium]
MSDFLYIVGEGAEYKEGIESELIEHIRASLSGTCPHTFIARIRVIVRGSHGGLSIEPLYLHKKIYADALTSIVNWIRPLAEHVVVRMEGHRGAEPLPVAERRSGTLNDVLKFRKGAGSRDVYLVEVEIT